MQLGQKYRDTRDGKMKYEEVFVRTKVLRHHKGKSTETLWGQVQKHSDTTWTKVQNFQDNTWPKVLGHHEEKQWNVTRVLLLCDSARWMMAWTDGQTTRYLEDWPGQRPLRACGPPRARPSPPAPACPPTSAHAHRWVAVYAAALRLAPWWSGPPAAACAHPRWPSEPRTGWRFPRGGG